MKQLYCIKTGAGEGEGQHAYLASADSSVCLHYPTVDDGSSVIMYLATIIYHWFLLGINQDDIMPLTAGYKRIDETVKQIN